MKRRSSRFHTATTCAVIALAPVMQHCTGKSHDASHAHAANRTEIRKVRLVRVQQVPLSDSVVASGTLAARETVVVSAKVPGRVVALPVDLGSKVARGQVIARLDAADYRLRVAEAEAAVAQARALLGLLPRGAESDVDVEQTSAVKEALATHEEAEKNLARARMLLERKLIGRAEVDALEASVARAESALASAREQTYGRKAALAQRGAELATARQALADATIPAPLAGVVQARHAAVGVLLGAGAPIVTIVDVDPLRLRLDLPEHVAARVRVGQRVRIQPERGPATEGQLLRVAPAIDEQSRTLAVEADIPGSDTLKAGSFVQAEVWFGDEIAVLAVPEAAIVTFAGIDKIITVRDGKAQEVVITKGRRVGQLREVTSGLTRDDQVVLEPGSLQTGDPVASEPEGPSRAETG